MSVYDFQASSIQGKSIPLSTYQGQVLLIVNTASACGFTPQYRGLEDLHEKFEARGLKILGFPCNQFGRQESGTEQEILSFCETNFGVTFPLFAKVDVNGANAHPLFKHLRKEKRGFFGTSAIKWNFTKFLVNRKGEVIQRYGPQTTPAGLIADIEAELNKSV